MRKIKKLSTAFFVLVLFLTLSAPAMAAAAIDTTHPVSLTISYQQDRKPIPGVPFALYRVADVNAYAEFTLSGDFKNYPVRLDGLDSAAWRALAETLAAYVQRPADAPGQRRDRPKRRTDLPNEWKDAPPWAVSRDRPDIL